MKTNLAQHKNLLSILNKFVKHFSTAPPQGAPNPNVPAIKTKDQLKVEALMENLPEALRHPDKDIAMQMNKTHIEAVYKHHQGDKKSLMRWDIPLEVLEVINQNSFTLSADNFADFISKYEGFIPDQYFVNRFHTVTNHYGDINQEFYDVILPKMKKIILNADKNGINAIATGAIGCAKNNIADAEFWEMVVCYNKLKHLAFQISQRKTI